VALRRRFGETVVAIPQSFCDAMTGTGGGYCALRPRQLREIFMRYFLVIATAVFATTAVANAATGSDGKWCLNTFVAGDQVNCSFQTLAQCNASKNANKDSCTPNPRSATTGSGHMKK
jgi:hypothetical protein